MTSFALGIPRLHRAVTTPAAPGTGLADETAGKDLTANVHVHSALETGRPAPDRYFHSPPAVTPSPMVLRTRTRMEPDSPEIGDIRGLVRRNGPLSRG